MVYFRTDEKNTNRVGSRPNYFFFLFGEYANIVARFAKHGRLVDRARFVNFANLFPC